MDISRESIFQFADRLESLLDWDDLDLFTDEDPEDGEISIYLDKGKAERRVSIVFREGGCQAWFLSDEGRVRQDIDIDSDAGYIVRWLKHGVFQR